MVKAINKKLTCKEKHLGIHIEIFNVNVSVREKWYCNVPLKFTLLWH